MPGEAVSRIPRWQRPPHLGARLTAEGCSFRLWAPAARQVDVLFPESNRRVRMQPGERGYHETVIADVVAGTLYQFVLDQETVLPDPASRHQPQGVHGPSAVVASDYEWSDAQWRGVPLEQLVIYELHVGTFTPEGTFDAVIPRLRELRELGITAIELMPIAQFPGSRNWGYDGVFPFAAQDSYGGPDGLRRLVDAAHANGLAVLLDVVYNHLGPEGNYLPEYGPYFTDRYRTPWGPSLNFDGPASDEVRAFFIASALQWLDEFHLDGLRLDAIHAIVDTAAYPFLRELADCVRELALDRAVVLIAESDLGDPRVILPAARGGLGMDAQWQDDFHHAVHALLTGEQDGYYADYGDIEHLARAYRHGFVYAGDFSRFRGRRHGQRPSGTRPEQLVVCAQNHDQVGNRIEGDRLSALVDHERLKLAAATVLLSPFTPLLFMGEEYGERAPFPYFVSHGDEELVAAVRTGRKEEFASFGWQVEPPDPQASATRERAVLHWEDRNEGEHGALLRLHRELLRLRREFPVLARFDELEAVHGDTAGGEQLLRVLRVGAKGAALLLLNYDGRAQHAHLPDGRWRSVLDTAATEFDGPGAGEHAGGRYPMSPHSAALLIRE